MRYFAVSFKDWVEIRQSRTPPKEQVSEVKRTLKHSTKPARWSDLYDGVWEAKPSIYTIKTIAHIGGKVLTVIPSKEFKKLTLLAAPKHGNMLELDRKFLPSLKELGRKYS